jgi:hypothetical protein
MSDPLVEFVLEEPVDRVEEFVRALESGSVTLETRRSGLGLAFSHGPRSLDRMLSILRAWSEAGGSEQLLATAVAGQLQIRLSVENRGPRCELVWTGDTPAGAGVRSTLPVVKEMLGWATRSVFVVSYSLWIGTGDAGDVVDRLAELSSSGVDITFVLDRRYQDGWNIRQLQQRWPAQRRRPSVYSWQDEADAIAKLHAKVLIVDRRDLLITSANLTGHGMRHNLEFGLRVLGRPAEDAAVHLDGLIRAGVFEEVPWP